MRVFRVPARYASTFFAEMERLEKRLNDHAAYVAEWPDSPGRVAWVADAEFDPARTGTLVAVVGDVSTEASVVLPFTQRLRAAS